MVERTGSSEELLASQGQRRENPWSFSTITRLIHWPTLGLPLWERAEQDSGLLQHWASSGHSEQCEALRRKVKGTNKPQISAAT